MCPDIFVFNCRQYREEELSAAFIYLRQPRLTATLSQSARQPEKFTHEVRKYIHDAELFQRCKFGPSPCSPACERRPQHEGQGPVRGHRHRRALHRVRGLQRAPRHLRPQDPRQPLLRLRGQHQDYHCV